MAVIMLVSAREAVGKTALCAGLALNFAAEGKKVGYFRLPAAESVPDADTVFMRKTLGLAEDVSPQQMLKEKDITLVEATVGARGAAPESQAIVRSAGQIGARVIAVTAYGEDLSRYLDVYRSFGQGLAGIIVNKVPVSQMGGDGGAGLEAAGMKILGCIPESRALLAITVAELAEAIGGKIISGGEKADELVENYMLGAMVVGSGRDYFGRKSHKAVIVRHERSDMQLAALETPTVCLVLSGDEPPMYQVLYKAQQRAIPIITTPRVVADIVVAVEEALQNSRLRQAKKLTGLTEIVRRNLKSLAFN